MTNLYEQLGRIIGDELGTEPVALTPETKLDDIPGWDSVTIAGVLLGIEETFGVVATRSVLSRLVTGADLARLCESR
jgi:acyl carrier protein